jgi:hypothetical protein
MILKDPWVLSIIVLIWAVVVIYTLLARMGKLKLEIRKLAPLEHIDEAIGRCAETGRPAHFTVGSGGYIANLAQADIGALIVAGLSVLAYVSEACARYKVPLITTVQHAETLPMYTEIIRQAYAKEGKPELFNPANIRYISPFQFAYAAGVMGILRREKPAASIVVGPLLAESLLLAEVGNEVGAIQIAGTSYTSQLPFLVTCCDYVLIGEETYAAGAYLSRDPLLTASIGAQDICKIIFMAFIGVSVILGAFGLKLF